jgi:hypothetical protein
MGYCRANPNYVVEYWQEKANWEKADILTLSLENREITDTDFTLELGGSISGQVLKADSMTPAQNACVSVSSTAPEWNRIGASVATDEDGNFVMSAVPTGGVYIRTQADCMREHPDLQDEWYTEGGSTPDASLADKVTLQAEQELRDVNFLLDVAPSTTVLPEEGGTLTSTADTTTTLSFSPDTVSQALTVTFKIVTSQPVTSSFSFLGQSFSIEATTAKGTLITTFSKPFTITIYYDDADVEGMEKESLKLYRWNSSEERWEELSASLDANANTITAVLDHLSSFAVLGKKKYHLYLPVVLRS